MHRCKRGWAYGCDKCLCCSNRRCEGAFDGPYCRPCSRMPTLLKWWHRILPIDNDGDVGRRTVFGNIVASILRKINL